MNVWRGQPTLGAVIADARARLVAAGCETAGLDARLLAAHTFGSDIATMIGHPERMAAAAAQARFEAALRRRLRREPLAYILGEREFWSLSLRVSRDTLIPRPDTETLIEAALGWHAHARTGGTARILDVGTGSGCLLLALLVELPAARGVGLDISLPALVVARENAERLGVAARASFVCADWASAISGQFDLIVCNPPYVGDAEWDDLAADIRGFEPPLALRGGSDGMQAYRRILAELPRLIAPDGAAFLELGSVGEEKIVDMAAGLGLQAYDVTRDLAGRRRCLQLLRRESHADNKFLGNQSVRG